MDESDIETTEQKEKYNTYKKYAIIGIVIVGLLMLVSGILLRKPYIEEQAVTQLTNQEVSMDEPLDIALDFYESWLNAVQSTSTDPSTSGLSTSKLLSESFRMQLMNVDGRAETEIDPVLCQTTIPKGVNARNVSQTVDVARVLVTAKEKELTAQSVFTLKRYNNGWYLDSVMCAPGEFELPREFSFEREGYLLKQVPPPLDTKYWHIVYEENGELGHAAPLFFHPDSSCVFTNGDKAICAPEQFLDATKVHAYGQMTEQGVEVTRLEFIE